ncbi:hypothetical protein BDN72DRAFT_839644 [Pluteus cervinus]|uniref:Uncharacterized protein n=1 Tax=Pluteus cervinus TaxID=181527 RepID=A0ACD3AWQ3_9AGAR|nr:hypothetical protein BDN72DRAFT_839644 [Pluteus cervinus]
MASPLNGATTRQEPTILPQADVHIEELTKLLSFCPPTLTQHPDARPSPQSSLLDFYDAHTDQRLQLRRVVVLPGLVQDLSDNAARTMKDLVTAGFSVPTPGNDDDWYRSGFRDRASLEKAVANAPAISRFYEKTIANSCLSVASSWVLHPHPGRYRRSLCFDRLYVDYVPFDVPRRDLEVCSLGIPSARCLPGDVMNSIPSQVAADIRELSGKKYGIWLFTNLSPHAEEAIQNMDRLVDDFQPFTCQTSGHPPRSDGLHQPPPLDSSHPLCRIPEVLLKDVTRLDASHSNAVEDGIRPNGLHSKNFTARDFVQHAWTQAVIHDITVIVFNTGNYERIGIRHRKSQTLFLSDLIHIPSCKNPAYGRLHVGLHVGIFQDALDRLHRRREQLQNDTLHTESTKLGKRQRSISPEPPRNIRQKLDSTGGRMSRRSTPQEDKFWSEINKRVLGLLYLRYKPYNSPVPVACRRDRPSLSKHGIGRDHIEDRQTYAVQESVDIILEAPFSCGAVGSIHTGRVSIRMSDGTYLEEEVVVKLATKPKYRRRIRSEYEAYHKLWSKPVRRGILPIYGLFEECNDFATFLVMGHGGISLAQRQLNLEPQDAGKSRDVDEEGEGQPIVTAKEREMFVSILEACHKASVCHRDIRPENLLINSEGEGFIIDFDRARIIRSSGDQGIEMGHFKAFLDGKPYDNERWSSFSSTSDT